MKQMRQKLFVAAGCLVCAAVCWKSFLDFEGTSLEAVRSPAAIAAIAISPAAWMKTLFTSFEQTTPEAWPTSQSASPTILISGLSCTTLGRAHGR